LAVAALLGKILAAPTITLFSLEFAISTALNTSLYENIIKIVYCNLLLQN
jgi:hypothetical protein